MLRISVRRCLDSTYYARYRSAFGIVERFTQKRRGRRRTPGSNHDSIETRQERDAKHPQSAATRRLPKSHSPDPPPSTFARKGMQSIPSQRRLAAPRTSHSPDPPPSTFVRKGMQSIPSQRRLAASNRPITARTLRTKPYTLMPTAPTQAAKDAYRLGSPE